MEIRFLTHLTAIKLKITLLTFFIFSRVVFCQEDSIKTYRLDQITIKGGKEVEAKVVNHISLKEIKSSDPVTVSDLGKLIPSVKVQTNSRGESNFYMRGAGERQVSILLDGLPLNIPWDNRIDLSLIPSNTIGEITAVKGIASVLLGANAISGVINLNSENYSYARRKIKLSFSIGNKNLQNYSVLYYDGTEQINFFLASSYDQKDGISLPASLDAGLYSADKTLINTDKKLFNFFGKFNYNFSREGGLGFSALYINTEKGVAPEMYVTNPRYWRYPEWKLFTASVTGDYSFNGVNPKIDFAFLLTNLKSKIDQYNDIYFTAIDDTEIGKDFIINGKIALTLLLNNNSLIKAALTGYSTTHEERIKSADYAEVLYAQNVISAAAEYEHFFEKLTFTSGISYDVSETPKTGIYTAGGSISDFNLMTGFVYSFDRNTSLHFSLGKKTRFPTLREAYSGALGRFVPNPALRAEAAYSVEAGIDKMFKQGKADLTLFVSYLKEGITRETLPERQFMRINKESIRMFGAEFSSHFILNKITSIYFHLSYLSAKGKDENNSFNDTLEYKPQVISFAQINIEPFSGIETLLEFQSLMKEFGLREGNLFFQRLPDYFLINLRVAYIIKFYETFETEVFFRVNNLFDRLHYSQWGIPSEGRAFKAGITLKY